MVSRVCGRCGVHALFTPIGPTNIVQNEYEPEVYFQSALKCAACEFLSLAFVELYPGMPGTEFNPREDPDRFWASVSVDDWLPTNAGPRIKNLPKTVESAAEDAFRCFKSQLYAPAVLMSRTTIEATAKAHGVIKGNLVEKIDKLHDQGLILESTKLAAHAIRTFGNDMAHGDLETDISHQDTRDIIELMQLILREVFELPFLAQKLQDRADARKN